MRCLPTIVPGSKILLVGEAPGEQEELLGRPFVGASGQELTRMLSDAGINRAECSLTNVFMDRPQNNDLRHFQCKKDEAAPGLPAMGRGSYLRPEYAGELTRLQSEIDQVQPNIIVALGAVPAWALLHVTSIGSIRGTVREGLHGVKVLATWHPAYILRAWQERAITVADFMKVKRESEFPEIRRPKRTIYIEPTIADLEEFLGTVQFYREKLISVDVETRRGQITVCGFALSKNSAFTIPFVDKRKPGHSYWETALHETFAYKVMKKVLEGPNPKLFQNGLYDIQYFFKYGIRPCNCLHDTMLRHHAIQPEMKKSLGHMGSLYTDEAPWKLMRAAADTVKRDE